MSAFVTKQFYLYVAVLTLALVAAGAGPSWADDDIPPPNAAAQGDLIRRALTDFPGRILKIEFERKHDMPSVGVYEVKILQDNGVVVEVEYDAITLKMLDVEKGDDWDDRKNKRKRKNFD